MWVFTLLLPHKYPVLLLQGFSLGFFYQSKNIVGPGLAQILVTGLFKWPLMNSLNFWWLSSLSIDHRMIDRIGDAPLPSLEGDVLSTVKRRKCFANAPTHVLLGYIWVYIDFDVGGKLHFLGF